MEDRLEAQLANDPRSNNRRTVGMMHIYAITGMHCQSCVQKITAALHQVPGVTSVSVSLKPPQAVIEMSGHVATAELARAVQSAGGYQLAEAPAEAAAASAGRLHQLGDYPSREPEAPKSLYPLMLIVAYIAGTVAVIGVASGEQSPADLMRYFMAGFFLVFSFFKLLDLRGFADAYRSYDIVTRAWPAWGFMYPFAELALGIAYLVNFNPLLTNGATLALMLVGAVGVLRALLDKRALRCACLGTALDLPMTTITLVEDLGMAAMAAAMLIMG